MVTRTTSSLFRILSSPTSESATSERLAQQTPSPTLGQDTAVLTSQATGILSQRESSPLPNPDGFWKTQETAQPSQDDLSKLQRGLINSGNAGGSFIRSVGEKAGERARNPLFFTPLGPLVGAANDLGIATPIPPTPKVLADAQESAVRGVFEFGASSVEEVTQAAAHPVATAQGLEKLSDAVLSTQPGLGEIRVRSQALLSGRSVAEVRKDKLNTLKAVGEGFVQDFQENREEIGIPGALVKSGFDIFGAPKASLGIGSRLKRLVRGTDDAATTARRADTTNFRQSDGYRKLNRTQKAQFDALYESAGDLKFRGDQTVKSLESLAQSGRLMEVDHKGVSVLEHLDNLRTQPRMSELADDSSNLLGSAIRMVDDANILHQGHRGSCAAVAVQFLHARNKPADFLRMTEELTRTGKTTWADGSSIKMPDSALKTSGRDNITGLPLEQPTRQFAGDPNDTSFANRGRLTQHIGDVAEQNRGPLSRIYQTTVMTEAGRLETRFPDMGLEYDNNLQKARLTKADGKQVYIEVTDANRSQFTPEQIDAGGLGGFRVRDNNTKQLRQTSVDGASGNLLTDGLSGNAQGKIVDKIFGSSEQYSVTPMLADGLNRKGAAGLEPGDYSRADIRGLQRLVASSIEAGRTGKPVILSTRWEPDSNHSNHSLVIVGMSAKGGFLLKNSQFDGIDKISGTSLPRTHAFSRLNEADNFGGNARDGITEVQPEDLLANMNGFRVVTE